MNLDSPVSLEPPEVVLRFLESVGRRSDAEFYLSLFRGAAKERFACICIDGPVIAAALEAVVVDLRFLTVLGLTPVLVLGVFDHENAAAHAQALVEGLERVGVASLRVGARDHAQVAQAARAQHIPIVALDPATGPTEAMRFAVLQDLVLALQTRKLLFLQRRGGMRSEGRRVPLVNLTHGSELLAQSPELSRKQRFLLTHTRTLICERAAHKMTAAVASPLELLRELFTVKGAGTLMRRGAVIQHRRGWMDVDVERLRGLLDSAFGRPVHDTFFSKRPEHIYLDDDYRGAAVVLDTPLGAYLSKFAVEREAQGEGIGGDLWDTLTADNPLLFWRSRRLNPIDPWYIRQCDGMQRQGEWNVFWRGFAPDQIADALAYALRQPEDFAPTAVR